MAAWRYQISLRVLKNIWQVSAAKYIFQHSKRNFVSPSGHIIFYLLYNHQWNTKSFHKRHRRAQCLYVTIATLIFSRVKMTCYLHLWRYHVFARKLTWYFLGVYITIWRYISAKIQHQNLTSKFQICFDSHIRHRNFISNIEKKRRELAFPIR